MTVAASSNDFHNLSKIFDVSNFPDCISSRWSSELNDKLSSNHLKKSF